MKDENKKQSRKRRGVENEEELTKARQAFWLGKCRIKKT